NKLRFFLRPENTLIVLSILIAFGRNKFLTYLISVQELDSILYLNYLLICFPNILSLGLLVQIPTIILQKGDKSIKTINVLLTTLLYLFLIASPLLLLLFYGVLSISLLNSICLYLAIMLNLI